MSTPRENSAPLRPETRHRWKRLLLFGAGALVVIGGAVIAFYCTKPFPFLEPQVRAHLGGAANARVIGSAHTVKAWRTLGSFRDQETITGANFGEFYMKAGSPALVPSHLAAELRRILLDPESYMDFDPPREKMSVTTPCVVLNFANSKANVDVFISFADDVMQVKQDKPAQRGSLAMAKGDFDPVRKDLVQIVKQIFPTDQQIQSLNATKSNGLLWPEPAR